VKHYDKISGWFNHEIAYDYLVSQVPTGGTVLELGAWLGRSSAYLADKVAEADRGITCIISDSWMGSPNELNKNHKLATETDIYEIFKENMQGRNYRSVRGLSTETVEQFEDTSLDVVFIDLTHSYDAVKQDIELWYPKVKPGGILSGHDYCEEWPGVMKAVDEKFPNCKVIKGCWIHHKNI
jgi:predicted O-methyltransferase YrrM